MTWDWKCSNWPSENKQIKKLLKAAVFYLFFKVFLLSFCSFSLCSPSKMLSPLVEAQKFPIFDQTFSYFALCNQLSPRWSRKISTTKLSTLDDHLLLSLFQFCCGKLFQMLLSLFHLLISQTSQLRKTFQRSENFFPHEENPGPRLQYDRRSWNRLQILMVVVIANWSTTSCLKPLMQKV